MGVVEIKVVWVGEGLFIEKVGFIFSFVGWLGWLE